MKPSIPRIPLKYNRKASITKATNDKKPKKPHFNCLKLPVKPNVFYCDFCDFGTLRKGTLVHHMKEVHTYEESECKICNNVYANKTKLKSHIKKMHENPKLFECLVCHKIRFKGYVALCRHVDNFHPEDKIKTTFKCNICDDKFYSKIMLDKHIVKEHSRQFKCFDKKCNRRFVDTLIRRKHHLFFHSRDLEVRTNYGDSFKVDL